MVEHVVVTEFILAVELSVSETLGKKHHDALFTLKIQLSNATHLFWFPLCNKSKLENKSKYELIYSTHTQSQQTRGGS